jgi:antitoxin ParD1/3/4
MAKVVKRTFSLTEAQAKFIDSKVASGSYASGSEVVRAGLREIEEWDATLQRWLHREVLPTLKKLDEDPTRARPLDEAVDEMLAEREDQGAPARRRA